MQVAAVHGIGILKPTGYFAHLLGAGLNRLPGVPIFFVISGVLISKSYEHSDSLRDYLRNRCLRIFPGLWVCLVVSVAVILALGVGSLGRITAPVWLLSWAGQMSIFQGFKPAFLMYFSTGLNGSLGPFRSSSNFISSCRLSMGFCGCVGVSEICACSRSPWRASLSNY